jgi:hypothetical protein
MSAPIVIIITRPPRSPESGDSGEIPPLVETTYGPDKSDLLKARDDLDSLIAAMP